MSKQQPIRRPTRKHIARAERERRQRNWIIAGTVVTGILVLGLVGFGFLYVNVILPNEPVAIVDGEEILTREFQQRVSLVLGPGADPVNTGQIILDTMIDEILLRHEAEVQGITISEQEVQKSIEEAFGYFAQGTPTRPATLTPDPTLLARATATPEPTEGPSPTVAPTGTPRPTATPYTREAFEQVLATQLAEFDERFNFTEIQFRSFFETQLYRQEFEQRIEEEVPREQEQTLLRHILVEDAETANQVLSELAEGAAWDDLVIEYSTDSITKEIGGDLGWMTETTVIDRFGLTVLPVIAQPVGEIVGPLETMQGWHVFEIMGREIRALSEFEFRRAVQNRFEVWLEELRQDAEIVIIDGWQERIPPTPAQVAPG